MALSDIQELMGSWRDGLISEGFEEIQPVHIPGKVSRISGNRFVAATMSTRWRFRRDHIYITMGPRTICIYTVIYHKPGNFHSFKTGELNIEDYRATIKKLMEVA